MLLVAWRRRSRLPDDPHEARLWLYGIAANTILDHRRGRRRLSDAVDRLRADIRALPPAAEPTGHDALDVRAAVVALPAGERELVRLVHWDGMSIADAAAVVGVNASTARSRYAKARGRLRSALGADEA